MTDLRDVDESTMVHFRLPGLATDAVLEALSDDVRSVAGQVGFVIRAARTARRGAGPNGVDGRTVDVWLRRAEAEVLAVVLDDLIDPLERCVGPVKGHERKSLLRSLRAGLANVEEALI